MFTRNWPGEGEVWCLRLSRHVTHGQETRPSRSCRCWRFRMASMSVHWMDRATSWIWRVSAALPTSLSAPCNVLVTVTAAASTWRHNSVRCIPTSRHGFHSYLGVNTDRWAVKSAPDEKRRCICCVYGVMTTVIVLEKLPWSIALPFLLTLSFTLDPLPDFQFPADSHQGQRSGGSKVTNGRKQTEGRTRPFPH